MSWKDLPSQVACFGTGANYKQVLSLRMLSSRMTNDHKEFDYEQVLIVVSPSTALGVTDIAFLLKA